MTKPNKLTRRDFLKAALGTGGVLLAGGLGYRGLARRIGRDEDPERTQDYLNQIQPAAALEQLPNIVLVMCDDLGYGDLGVYGSQAIQTPNLDRMAAEGVRLTHFYSAAPLCSPSRAGLLTGRYPIRTMVTGSLYPAGSAMHLVMDLAGFYTQGVTGIPPDEALLPEILQRRGYATALLGKWHLGDRSPHLPNENGFDVFYGAHYSNGMQPYRIYRNDQVEIDESVDQSQLTCNLTREALAFIEQHRSQAFFLYLAHIMPHEPVHASAAFRGRSRAGLYGDAVEEIDWSVGQVLAALANYGLEENTLVIFTSDNGPWWQGSPGGLRGRKNLPEEGGFRVPLIARWPGVLPQGEIRDGMSMNFDLFATCLSLAGVAGPRDRVIDGRDLLPYLQGTYPAPHDTLFYFKGHNLVGVRQGRWKYLRRHMTDNGGYTSLSQGPFLFDLELDPAESYSLIESQPDLADQLEALLQRFDAEIEANLRGWI
ncbi:MAG: sulfatase [Anaerolineales bacterium]|nr:sulfatase [Anaerolineales bacterium]